MATVLASLLLPLSASAATFSGNANIQAGVGTTSLSAAAGVNAFTASCWFRMVIPTGTNLIDHMTILMDRTDGNEGANFSYLIRYNINNNTVEFLTKGSSGELTIPLIVRPYLDRWYHVAVVRANNIFSSYVDGRSLPQIGGVIGDTVGSGLSIGGHNGTTRPFYGDIIEVAAYQFARNADAIRTDMKRDQRANGNLRGYYKLGYSTNAADNLRNFVPTPPAGTDPATKVGVGTIEFEETDPAGEQSTFDSRKNKGADALVPLSGAFTWSDALFDRSVPGIHFDFQVGYSTATPTRPEPDGSAPFGDPPLGPGWRHSFEARLVVGETFNDFQLILWDGAIETWSRTNLTAPLSTRHKEYRGELVALPNSDFEWTTSSRLVYRFQDPITDSAMKGRLREIRDFNGNRVTLQWNENDGILTNVVDTARGNYRLNYSAALLMTNLTFQSWQLNFTYDTTNRLISQSFTNTSGLYTNVNTPWQFAYNTNGLLESITDPRTNRAAFVQYDQYGRKTNQVDALGRATVTKYGSPGKRQITHVDPGTNSWVETYDRKHRLLSQADPLGQTTSYTYDAAGNRLSITEPLGYITYFGYDERANVIVKTNAAREVSRWSFHPFFNKATNDVNPLGWTNYFVYDDARGNLLRHYDGLGTLVTYAYETNGLVLASVDANGNTSRFAYNTNGFLIAKTDPATNTTSFALNEVGWKFAETNALGQVATFAYDLNGRAVLAVDSLLRRFTNVFDANGNLLSANDGKGQLTRTFFDAANQKTQTIDRAGFTNLFFYTSRGKLDRATDALGNSATNFYDSANRLVRISDPLGNTVTNTYDANGNLIAFLDQTGQRFTKSYDRLDRVIAESDPLGNTRRTTFDSAGRVSQVLTPNGYPSTHTYDGRGRLTQWVDAEKFPWLYDYDPVGNITNITDALFGHYVMTYGNRNERLSELNQDGKLWTYAYDPLLRLTRQTDPNGTTRTPSYDAAGRVLSVGFNTGRTNSFNYDANNNPTNISRLYQGNTTATRLAYDVLDRATNQVDALFQSVGYAYDAIGRMTNLVYPGISGPRPLAHRYDALGRLTNQVDWANRPMNYAYDRAGRLVSRTYPNGVVQTNTFDTAGRLTSLSYLTNSTAMIALTYAYDRNGNKSFMGEKGTFAWPQPTLTDDKSRFTPAGRLIDRQVETSTANPPTNSYTWTYRYDASGNLTNATGGGQAYTLAYDEDNRTTSIAWDNGLTAKTIANRYDALGRRISRTADGAATGYVLSLVGGMERILCDLNPDSTFTYYVHGPDLAYKEAADGTVTYYHADAQANIISLTGANAATVAQYAYTPYGRSLGSTNTLPAITSQPFNFVGSQGVMEELPGLYFMRARYYSADAGVFISTDPVKKIGSGWKPMAYAYANGNSIVNSDPKGEEALTIMAAAWMYYKFEQTVLKTVNQFLNVAEVETARWAKTSTEEQYDERIVDIADGVNGDHAVAASGSAGFIGLDVAGDVLTGQPWSKVSSTLLGYVPLNTTKKTLTHSYNIIGNTAYGLEQALRKSISQSSTASASSTATTTSIGTTKQSSPASGGAVKANSHAATMNLQSTKAGATWHPPMAAPKSDGGKSGGSGAGNKPSTTPPPPPPPPSSSTSFLSNVVNAFRNFFSGGAKGGGKK